MIRPERGFSLIEVMIAAGIMMVIAMGAYELLSSSQKTAGDLEKRLRWRDLVDDIRFVFMQPELCHRSFHPSALTEGAPVELDLSSSTTLKGGLALPDYGLKVTRLYVKDVQKLPAQNQVLFQAPGEALGLFVEEDTAADLYLEASLLGSGHALKPINVVRVMIFSRKGVIDQEGCYGNHGEFTASAATSTSRLPEPSGIIGNRSMADCTLSAEQRQAMGRARVIEGEIFRYQNPFQQQFEASCSHGALSLKRLGP